MCGKKVSEVQLAPSVFTSILRNDYSFLLRNVAHFVDEVESISCTKWSPFRVRNGYFYTEKKHAARSLHLERRSPCMHIFTIHQDYNFFIFTFQVLILVSDCNV